MSPRDLDAAVVRLQGQLDDLSAEKTRDFWERYLKGSATFRGVPMARVRKALHRWWKREGFDARPVDERKAIALRLFREPHTEDRLAGTLALAEILLESLDETDLPQLALLFEHQHIADWNLCDWFCVKVLGPMILAAPDPAARAREIAAWRDAEPLWQRRASCVAFVNLARDGDRAVPGLTDLLLQTAAVVARSRERFAQTAVGWSLRELSRAEPARVIAFAEHHAASLSREGVRSVTEKIAPGERERLLALHLELTGRRPAAR